METKQWTTIDKKGWPRGEWDEEPDKVQWPDAETGLPCLAVRGPGGNWCGYVGLAEGHALYGKHYDDVDVRVHGGLTFADACHPGATEATGICHVPSKGEPDHIWWLGFDCAHLGDVSPAYQPWRYSGYDEWYKNLSYVQRQCAFLAKQLFHHPVRVFEEET